MKSPLLFSLFAAIALGARADVRCALPFGDHMVLQRELPVPVWGTATPGEHIRVSFAGQTREAVAGSDGRWRVALAPLAANTKPEAMEVVGARTIRFEDVLVGEVWLCSGQSNMEKPLGLKGGQKPTDDWQAEVAAADHPDLRLFQVPLYAKADPKEPGSLSWVRCSSATVGATQFSAAGYFFGRDLQKALGVPVGLIHTSYGGTRIEAWMPPEAFASDPQLAPLARLTYDAWVPGVQHGDLHHSMIEPFEPFALRGFVWYQGESNCMDAEGYIYARKTRALIGSWRARWGLPHAAFYYVQIAPFDYSRWDKFPKKLTPLELPVFWEAQEAALDTPETGMISTLDLVRNVHDIHPTDKRDVGLRLARLALARTYHMPAPVAESPRLAGAMPAVRGRIELRFSDCGSGLVIRGGGAARGFEVAGADRQFHPAHATLSGDRVGVENERVREPVAVRYAWNETPDANVENSSGLPLLPFRTDHWEIAVERTPSGRGPTSPGVGKQ